MPIYGITHTTDGTAILRRSVTTKLAIGLPPDGKSDHPQQLDHFIFQKKTQRGSGISADVIWEIDQEKTEHFGRNCREVGILLLDDDPDVVFRTEYAWWTRTQKQCWGDGESATRRTVDSPRGERWEPCANERCLDLEEERCRPSGDLYFLLADYPTLGTICKLHTSSYQSIREIYAALETIRNVTGGRLKGLRLRLFVRAEKNTYTDKKRNSRMSGTKHVLGLELITSEVKQLQGQTIEAVDAFRTVKRQLAEETIRIDDPESGQAAAVSAEFYPASQIKPASDANHHETGRGNGQDEVIPPELQNGIEDAFSKLNLTTARRLALLDQHKGNPGGLLDQLTRELNRRAADSQRSAERTSSEQPPSPSRNGSNNRPHLNGSKSGRLAPTGRR